MRLDILLQTLYANLKSPPWALEESLVFLTNNNIKEFELYNSISAFVTKLAGGIEISLEEFDEFTSQVTTCPPEVQNILGSLIYDIAQEIYARLKPELDSVVHIIDEDLKNSNPISQEPRPTPEKYMSLLILYKLESCGIHIGPVHYYMDSRPNSRELKSYIPFGINALVLTGKIPRGNCYGIDTTKGLYPLYIVAGNHEKLALKKGIKLSDRFFPYKPIYKLHRGDTLDNTFLATDGSKAVFMRGSTRMASAGVFASKVATLISREHFASERLMDNRIVGSKALPSYVCSLADESIRAECRRYIEEEQKIFPGTGIIDEVLNYVLEMDPNLENYGLSSRDIQQAHLS